MSVVYGQDVPRWVNAAYAQAVGRPFGEILNRPYSEFFPPKTAQLFAETNARVLASGSVLTLEQEAVLSYGSPPKRFLTTKGPVKDCGGRLVGVVGVAAFITNNLEAGTVQKGQDSCVRLLAQVSTLGLPSDFITQQDLAEEILLRIEAAETLRRLKEKRVQIRQALKRSAPVEAGPHAAQLLPWRECSKCQKLCMCDGHCDRPILQISAYKNTLAAWLGMSYMLLADCDGNGVPDILERGASLVANLFK